MTRTPFERVLLSTTSQVVALARPSSCSRSRRFPRTRAQDPFRASGGCVCASRSPCCCSERATTARSTASASRRPSSRSGNGRRLVTTCVRARIADRAKDRSARALRAVAGGHLARQLEELTVVGHLDQHSRGAKLLQALSDRSRRVIALLHLSPLHVRRDVNESLLRSFSFA